MHRIVCATVLGLLAVTYAAGAASAVAPTAKPGAVLAQGAGGVLTRGAADAYIEALEFMLSALGQPTALDDRQRSQVRVLLAARFTGLPAAEQAGLVNLRGLWALVRAEWGRLPLEVKQEFAYGVLRLAYGGPAAAKMLGGAGGGSALKDYYSNRRDSPSISVRNGCSYVVTSYGGFRSCN